MAEVDRKIEQVALGLPASLSLPDFESFDTTGGPGSRGSYFLGAVSPTGELLASNILDAEGDYRPDVSTFTPDGLTSEKLATTVSSIDGESEWRLHKYTLSIVSEAAMTTNPALLVIGVDLQESRQTVASFSSIFVSFGLVAIILSALLSRLLVTSTLKPLREVELTAARFAGGDFSQRLGNASPQTEVVQV